MSGTPPRETSRRLGPPAVGLRVLVAEDDDASRSLLGAVLCRLGHEPVLTASGEDAWAAYREAGADVLVTDWMMPGCDGPELCRRIRTDPVGLYTYVIFLTAMTDREHALAAMEAGADDHLAKPLHPLDLEARMVAAERVTALHRDLDRYRTELSRLHREAVAAARTDPLTGLGNRRRLSEDLDGLTARYERYGSRAYLAVFDLDRFKAYNDRYGHPAGDAVLAAVAEALRTNARRGDAFYRLGGEEFLAVLPELEGDGAVAAGERLRRAVADLAIPHEGNLAGVVTASVGVAALDGDPAEALARADRMLYAAKAAGRDRVVATETSA